jgi:hypothetical protein
MSKMKDSPLKKHAYLQQTTSVYMALKQTKAISIVFVLLS